MYNLRLVYTSIPCEFSSYELHEVELHKDKALKITSNDKVYNFKTLNEVFGMLNKKRIDFKNIKFFNITKNEENKLKEMFSNQKIINLKTTINNRKKFINKNIKFTTVVYNNKNNKLALGIDVGEYGRLVNSQLIFALLDEISSRVCKKENIKNSFQFYNIISKENYIYFLYNYSENTNVLDYSDFKEITLKMEDVFLLKELRKQVKRLFKEDK